MREKLSMLNFSDGQKKLLKMLGVLLILILIVVVIAIVAKIIAGSKVSYAQYENILVRAAEQYVNANPEVIEAEIFGTTEIDSTTLSTKGYMKDITKYFGEETNCEAKVLVYKNLDYYKYIPKLTCGSDYSVKSLSEVILDEKNIVTSGSGLYQQGDIYTYRGEYLDNYVSYSGKTWRIIGIDEDKNIKMIQVDDVGYSSWDNRYNSDYGYASGINSFESVEASRIKNTIMKAYNGDSVISEDAKKLIVPKEYCIGKRSKDDTTKDNSTECSVKSELMGATVLTVSDYLNASLDSECNSIKSKSCVNYNYLSKFGVTYWTATAQTENTGYAYAVSGNVQTFQTSSSYVVKLVVTVNGSINYIDGTGTSSDPYIIK